MGVSNGRGRVSLVTAVVLGKVVRCVSGVVGEKNAGPAAALGPRRQRLHANSVDGSEGLLLSAPLRVVASALQTLKVGIRPKPLTLFSDWFAVYASCGLQKRPCTLASKASARPARYPSRARFLRNMSLWTRFVRITELAACKTLA